MSDPYIRKNIVIKYPQGRWILVKRNPTNYEIEKRKFSPNKMIDYSELVTNNELEIKIYNVPKEDFVTVRSGGHFDFKEKSPSGTVIDIRVKYADEELKRDINDLMRELCKLHLRPCICYPGLYSTRGKIDYFLHTEDEGKKFLNEFIQKIQKRVEKYSIGKKLPDPLSEFEKKIMDEDKQNVREYKTEEEKIDGKVIIGECSYHLCRKENIEVETCPYCKKYFCSEHITPKIPLQANFRDVKQFDEWKKGKNYHPCPQYYDYLREQERLGIQKNTDMYNRTNKKQPTQTISYKKIPTRYKWSVDDKSTPPTENQISRKKSLSEKVKIRVNEDRKELKNHNQSKGNKCFFCSIESNNLTKCEFCGEKFCKNHIQPKTMHDFLRTKGGHSCKPYAEQIEIMKKIEKKPYKKIMEEHTQTGLIKNIILFFLILLFIFSLWLCYNNASTLLSDSSQLNFLNENIANVQNDINSIKSQISSSEYTLSNIHNEVVLRESGKIFNISKPTYSEVLIFLIKDKTDQNQYSSDYTCTYFSKDVCNNAVQQGIRCGFVEITFIDSDSSGHAIVAFDTSDKGVVYFEPQHDARIYLEIGKRFYQCLEKQAGYYWIAPSYDDTIKEIICFW